mmetsp:Transcript_8310/g.12702  ORF Transcript_8310/g.12702 Transcript_8310/m.12702 type:complete len:114 (+) Transcript_8310:596-937(+)
MENCSHEVSDESTTLTMSFEPPSTMKKGDYLYVALAHPYSYADYLLSLKEVAEKCKINENQIFCQVDQLCTSLEGRDVHLLTLASHHAIETRRPIIFLTGRVHAGESPGSYLV